MISNKLCFGAVGDEVRKLQEHLKGFGFYQYNIDGVFGDRTIEAVYLFQDACDLKIDGIVGPKTINEINKLLMLPEEKRFIIIAIEYYRLKMYELADRNNFTDPEVIAVSQHLDKLINEYNKK